MKPMPQPRSPHAIIPPYLLGRVADAAHRFPTAAEAAQRSLLFDAPLREGRLTPQPRVEPREHAPEAVAGGQPAPVRRISDAQGTEHLPGQLVRAEGGAPSSDPAVNQAYDGLGATFELYARVYGRDSIDGHGMALEASVHFGQGYDNAFWNGERMVFGDGDGEVFGGFTASVSVIGHELTHGVTEKTAALQYQGQSGALNEHVSDAFGALVEQYSLGQDAGAATWLIGAGVFTAKVHGRAIRSMLEPGTAYDDPVLGRDPQPADMAHYVQTTDDNGGVHLNSGIPNRAFALAARQLGGFAWETVGHVWYDTLVSGRLPADATFARFAAETVGAATARFGAGSREESAVAAGWQTVGVVPAAE